MVVDGWGTAVPVSSSRADDGFRVNRRVDIWILPEP
jgi:outer membrane protein OmpA-like peptidoglycan-associated protein